MSGVHHGQPPSRLVQHTNMLYWPGKGLWWQQIGGWKICDMLPAIAGGGVCWLVGLTCKCVWPQSPAGCVETVCRSLSGLAHCQGWQHAAHTRCREEAIQAVLGAKSKVQL